MLGTNQFKNVPRTVLVGYERRSPGTLAGARGMIREVTAPMQDEEYDELASLDQWEQEQVEAGMRRPRRTAPAPADTTCTGCGVVFPRKHSTSAKNPYCSLACYRKHGTKDAHKGRHDAPWLERPENASVIAAARAVDLDGAAPNDDCGASLRDRRERAGIPAVALCALADCGPAMIQNIEAGYRPKGSKVVDRCYAVLDAILSQPIDGLPGSIADLQGSWDEQ